MTIEQPVSEISANGFTVRLYRYAIKNDDGGPYIVYAAGSGSNTALKSLEVVSRQSFKRSGKTIYHHRAASQTISLAPIEGAYMWQREFNSTLNTYYFDMRHPALNSFSSLHDRVFIAGHMPHNSFGQTNNIQQILSCDSAINVILNVFERVLPIAFYREWINPFITELYAARLIRRIESVNCSIWEMSLDIESILKYQQIISELLRSGHVNLKEVSYG